MMCIVIKDQQIYVNDEEATDIAKQIFTQQKISDVGFVLNNKNIKATQEQIEKIAENLYDEIFEHDDLYFELEDKNILYLAEKYGIKNC